jgi:hypothetical protein
VGQKSIKQQKFNATESEMNEEEEEKQKSRIIN